MVLHDQVCQAGGTIKAHIKPYFMPGGNWRLSLENFSRSIRLSKFVRNATLARHVQKLHDNPVDNAGHGGRPKLGVDVIACRVEVVTCGLQWHPQRPPRSPAPKCNRLHILVCELLRARTSQGSSLMAAWHEEQMNSMTSESCEVFT